jgi:hypothetical protein
MHSRISICYATHIQSADNNSSEGTLVLYTTVFIFYLVQRFHVQNCHTYVLFVGTGTVQSMYVLFQTHFAPSS